MDPCPFVRIVIGNLALRFPDKSSFSSHSFYCKFKLKGFPTQVSDVSFLAAETDSVESRIHGCFAMSTAELVKLAERSSGVSCLKIEIHRRSSRGSRYFGFFKRGKLLGCVVVRLDLKIVLENPGKRVIQNGWVVIGSSDAKLHLVVRAETDPRFVFRFDGDPECSPQIFQVNGNVKQPVFSCKFGLRNSAERNLRSR